MIPLKLEDGWHFDAINPAAIIGVYVYDANYEGEIIKAVTTAGEHMAIWTFPGLPADHPEGLAKVFLDELGAAIDPQYAIAGLTADCDALGEMDEAGEFPRCKRPHSHEGPHRDGTTVWADPW